MSISAWRKKFLGMPNSKKYCKMFKDFPSETIQIELYYSHWIDHRKDGYFIEQMEDWTREVRFKMNKTELMEKDLAFFVEIVSGRKVSPSQMKQANLFGNCTEAATPPTIFCYDTRWPTEQETGNNPMRYEQINATAVVTASPSDEALQRQYLLSQLQDYTRNSWRDNSKYSELRKMFFLDTPRHPENASDLLDAIKNGKYTVDEKKLAARKKYDETAEREECYDDSDEFYSVWFGVTFTDFPKADRKGYDAAVKDYEKVSKDTERKIIVGTPAEGLDALLALEAWVPAGKAN